MTNDNPLLSPPRETIVPLYPRDVEAKLEEYDKKIEDAWRAEAATSRMGTKGKTAADKLAAERDAFVEKVEESTPTAVLRELDQRKYQRMLDKHPPRKNNQRDEAVGYNRETFPPEFIRACMVEPVVTDAQFEEFVEKCPAGRWDEMIGKALEATLGEVELPKSSAVLALRVMRERAQRPRAATA